MPIRPENMKRYPGGSTNSKEWKAIREKVKERSGDVCEGSPAYPECRAPNGEPHPVTGSKVVLTVAHLDHMPENSDLDNLRHWCQKCHNTYDAPRRADNRRRNQKLTRDLFPL